MLGYIQLFSLPLGYNKNLFSDFLPLGEWLKSLWKSSKKQAYDVKRFLSLVPDSCSPIESFTPEKTEGLYFFFVLLVGDTLLTLEVQHKSHWDRR